MSTGSIPHGGHSHHSGGFLVNRGGGNSFEIRIIGTYRASSHALVRVELKPQLVWLLSFLEGRCFDVIVYFCKASILIFEFWIGDVTAIGDGGGVFGGGWVEGGAWAVICSEVAKEAGGHVRAV